MVTKLSRHSRSHEPSLGVETARKNSGLDPLLVIEDDAKIAGLISVELRDAGFKTEWAANAQSGLQRFERGAVQLIILDLTLPDLDGLQVCEKIRSTDRLIPIMMLTARAAKSDVVRGLELGADDYMTKPFDSMELIARVRALLRRRVVQEGTSAKEPSPGPLCIGPLTINEVTREAHLDGNLIDLTAKEFELLLLFAKHPGRPFTRDSLLGRVWGDGFEGYEHTVNTHINRLRNKLTATTTNHSSLIETVWGVGYRFTAQSDS